MKSGKLLFSTGGLVTVTALLVALTWAAAIQSISSQREQTQSRAEALLTSQAAGAASQIDRQIAVVDQMLLQMATAWANDSTHFDVAALRAQAIAVNGLANDVIVADEQGIIRQSTLPEAVGQRVSSQDFFITLADRTNRAEALYLGAPSISPILRQWHLNAARVLRQTDGTFAGVIDTDYRVTAIDDVLQQLSPGPGGIALLVGLTDGKLRGATGLPPGDPDISIRETPLFRELRSQTDGIWIGRSPVDAITRIHAFRQLPNRNLAVTVAADLADALAPANAWERLALLYASVVTVLLGAIAWMMIRRVSQAVTLAAAGRRQTEQLAAATAEAEVYRAMWTARSEQLETALGGSLDGICIIDRHLCLVEWNQRLPANSGIPVDRLRIGMPLEEMLRMQAAAGEFGPLTDADTEIARRMSRLRTGPYPTVRRQRPNGTTIEIRRRALPDGGFVTFFSDVSALTRSEEALRHAQSALDVSRASAAQFVTSVLSDLRSAATTLMRALGQLTSLPIPREQQPILALAQGAGAATLALAGNIEELARLEAGEVTLRLGIFDLAGLVAEVADSRRDQVRAAGAVPERASSASLSMTLYSDAGRIRQLLLAFIDIAVRSAGARAVAVDVRRGRTPQEGAVISVRGDGSALDLDATASLLRTPTSTERPRVSLDKGCDVRLSICNRLAALLGVEVGCEAWASSSGEAGLAFWLVVPQGLVFQQSIEADGPTAASAGDDLEFPLLRRLPRTRVLLVEDVPASQMVTATLLRRDGHLVDIAASGEEAIAAVERHPYDIVLMDLLMPGLSGQRAAAAIRKLPAAAGSVPIVALTAQVDTGDDDAFKRDGFDSLVSKPASLRELLDVLGRVVWYRQQPAKPAHRSAEGQGDTPVQSTILATDRLQELRTNLSPATFVELVEECLIDLDHQLPALRRAMKEGALGAVIAHAHAMVGMAAGYGMASLEASLRSILAAARAGERSELGREAIAQVEAELAAATRALREMMQDVLA